MGSYPWNRRESYLTGAYRIHENKVGLKTGKVNEALCTFGLKPIRQTGSKVVSRVTG